MPERQTLARTPGAGWTSLVAGCLLLLWSAGASAAAGVCAGDCNRDGEVSIEDVVFAIAVGVDEMSGCSALDLDSNDTLAAGEVHAAIESALAGCVPPRWQQRAALPQARQEVGVAELDGKVYVVGGIDSRLQTLALVEVYDPSSDQWSQTAPLPQPLHHVVAVSAGGRLYALGGMQTLQFIAVSAVFAYDPDDELWTRRADLPAPRGAGAAAVVGGKIYFAGGLRQGSVDDFAVYDPLLDQWQTLPAMPTARDHLGAAAIDGLFYAVGGRAQQLYDIVEVFDPEARSWSTRARMPTARGGLAVAAFDGQLFTMGGEGNPLDRDGIFRETEAYDPTTDKWRKLPNMRTPRHGTAAAVIGAEILVPGGATVAAFGASAVSEALIP